MKRFLPIFLVLLLLPLFGVGADGENKLIQTGDKGEEVVRIQTRLFDLGYYTYKPTGSFQTVTKSAVISYQVASGLMSDGSVGEQTMETLFSRNTKRVSFHAEVPLTYSAQGVIVQKGNPIPWDTVKTKLTQGEMYRIRNAAGKEEVTLTFDSGTNHADMSLPENVPDQKAAAETLSKWLGETNSFYKCAVLFELDGQWVAASMQWNGENRVCVYFRGSLSHVRNLKDVEHEANIGRVGN